MARAFVGFDDSYRVPVPVNVSRAVSCAGIVHLCGQLHMDGAGNAEDPCDVDGRNHPRTTQSRTRSSTQFAKRCTTASVCE